jgi:homocitrate synthase NifV
MEGLGLEPVDEERSFELVQLCNAMTGRPLTDDELRLIATYPAELSLLFPGQLD